ncbi:MAG: Fe-S cluster assembly ATPase SufC [Candidatus Puniceispirillales bacterium]
MNLLKIDNLYASIGEEKILNGFSLEINAGETHAIMGPNGSGKSTLSYVLSGKNDYDVNKGTIHLKSKNIIDLEPDERSKLGLFLAFQYPIELPGVTGMTFLRTIINSSRLANNLPELEGIEIVKMIREKAANLEISQEMLKRFVNVGFSGGEKKRFEILQMSLLNPSIAILDETDSGLDVDALRIVGNGVTELKSKDRGMLVITHYQRLLDHIIPDFVHIMVKGKIVESGGPELAKVVEKEGYKRFIDEN